MEFRSLINSAKAALLQGGWSSLVTLTSPAGIRYQDLRGVFFNESAGVNAETGEDITVEIPKIWIDLELLPVVPKAGETWFYSITTDSGSVQYMSSVVRPPHINNSIGFICLFLQDVEQI